MEFNVPSFIIHEHMVIIKALILVHWTKKPLSTSWPPGCPPLQMSYIHVKTTSADDPTL